MSGIITKTNILFSNISDSHEKILSENNIKDISYGKSREFLRFELIPNKSITSTNKSEWDFNLDEESDVSELPDWYNKSSIEIIDKTYSSALSLIKKGRYLNWECILDLGYTKITELPDNLNVRGSLYLYNTKITKLPNNLAVGAFLDLEGTCITELPNDLSVGASIDLKDSKITKLPDNLNVRGSLYLMRTPIKLLPNNLNVKDDLVLTSTAISVVPTDLNVGGFLFLGDTKITEIPDKFSKRILN
jgi:hypothetical protein